MSKSEMYNKLKTQLENYTGRLVSRLVDSDLLVKLDKPKGHYSLSSRVIKTRLSQDKNSKSIFSELFELRNIAQNVCTNLYPDASAPNLPLLSRSLLKLEENHAVSLTWKRKDEILDTLDKLDMLVNDGNVHNGLQKMLEEDQININRITNGLLEFYGTEKASRFFHNLNYHGEKRELKTGSTYADLVLDSSISYYSPLIFEFKVRRSGASPDNQMLLGALKMIKDLTSEKNPRPYIFLVVFTHENFQSFEVLKFQFREAIHSLSAFDNYYKQIKFVPVSFSGLHLIDYSFEEFNKQFIQNHFKFNFQAQVPPTGFPDRDDHFIDTVFDVRLSEFIIDIHPVNTKYWRLGFRFVKDEKFPPLASGRHGNTEVADIHISVGDIVDTEKNTWGGANQLILTNYNAPIIENTLGSLLDYDGGPVTLFVASNGDASDVLFSVQANGKQQGIRKFNLKEYGSCRIFAWADYLPFNLETEIKVIHKGK